MEQAFESSQMIKVDGTCDSLSLEVFEEITSSSLENPTSHRISTSHTPSLISTLTSAIEACKGQTCLHKEVRRTPYSRSCNVSPPDRVHAPRSTCELREGPGSLASCSESQLSSACSRPSARHCGPHGMVAQRSSSSPLVRDKLA